MAHDRFRYGLITAAYGLGIFWFFFFRVPAAGLSGHQYRIVFWPWFWTSFTLPTAALVIVLIYKSLAKRDPWRANYDKFRRTYELFLDLAVLLAVVTQALLVSKILILEGTVGRWISYVPTTLIGLILIVFGNVLPRLRPNSVIGVRTRWALADEAVWMTTHRAGGYFLLVFGLALIVWTFVDFQGVWWVLGPGAVLTVVGFPFLSYVIWKRRHPAASVPSRGGAGDKEIPS